jgi:hypothetical protein
MKLLRIVRSHNPEKKWDAVFETESGRTKTVPFGFRGMEDFTLTGSVEQREAYRSRHRKDLETGDPTRPGFLSWYILWNKPSMEASIKDYKRRFNL